MEKSQNVGTKSVFTPKLNVLDRLLKNKLNRLYLHIPW